MRVKKPPVIKKSVIKKSVIKKKSSLKSKFSKIKNIFKKKQPHLEKDMHTYGFVFTSILRSKNSSQSKLRRLTHLKKCVVDIKEKRINNIKDPEKRKEAGKEYQDLLNKIILAEILLSK